MQDLVRAAQPKRPTRNADVKAQFHKFGTKVPTDVSEFQKTYFDPVSGCYWLRVRAVQGGSSGDTIEDQPDFPLILAHGTSVDAIGGVFIEGIAPRRWLRRDGCDEVHVLPIETPAEVGGQPPTELPGIDFVGLSDKSGWRGASQCAFLSTLMLLLAAALSLEGRLPGRR